MKRLELTLPTGDRSFADLRPYLDRALEEHFAEGFLDHSWHGDVLELRGPGAKGSIVLAGGTLRLQADLTPPASWAHKTIRAKAEAALDDLARSLATDSR